MDGKIYLLAKAGVFDGSSGPSFVEMSPLRIFKDPDSARAGLREEFLSHLGVRDMEELKARYPDATETEDGFACESSGISLESRAAFAPIGCDGIEPASFAVFGIGYAKGWRLE